MAVNDQAVAPLYACMLKGFGQLFFVEPSAVINQTIEWQTYGAGNMSCPPDRFLFTILEGGKARIDQFHVRCMHDSDDVARISNQIFVWRESKRSG